MRHSNRPMSFLLTCVLFSLTLLPAHLAAEEPPAMEMDPAMMEAFAKASQPDAHHEHLAELTGSWKVTSKMWMGPGQPPIESTGEMEGKMILGGRFLETRYSSEIMGQPFEGRGVDGYDTIAGKHVGYWFDTMGTYTLNFSGGCSDDHKVTTMTAEFTDPMSGSRIKNRGVTTILNADQYKYESWMTGADGNEMKVMELVATRK